jgi:hypothetical protein
MLFVRFFGTNVSAEKLLPDDILCLKFEPFTFFLRKIDRKALFSELERKIQSGEKASRVELFELIMLPRIGAFDFDLLLECMALAIDKTLVPDEDLLAGCLVGFSNIYSHLLTDEQKKEFRKMEYNNAFVMDGIEIGEKKGMKLAEKAKKALEETKKALEEAKKAAKKASEEAKKAAKERDRQIAIGFLKGGATIPIIAENCNVSKKWLLEQKKLLDSGNP